MSSRPRRILYVLNSASTGGANRSLSVLLSGLDRRRFAPVVTVPREGPFIDWLRRHDIDVVVMPLPSLARTRATPWGRLKAGVRNGRNLARLVRLIRAQGIDLVHTSTVFPVGGALAARRTGRPHVWHLREGLDTPEYDLRFGPAWSRTIVGALADRAICISEYVRRTSLPAARRAAGVVVPNALQTVPDVEPRRAGEAPVVGCVGLIGRKKRTAVFVDMARRVAASRDDVRFLVAGRPVSGEAEVLETCRQAVAEAGLADRFTWPGFVADPADLYRQLALLVHPGVHEAFGRVLIEAMSWGLPVVGTASGAVPEVVRDGRTGRVVPPDDADALAAATLAILDDPPTYASMSAAALDDVRERFSPGPHVARVTGIYEELLGK